jgi:hypothetical protein
MINSAVCLQSAGLLEGQLKVSVAVYSLEMCCIFPTPNRLCVPET